MFSLCGCYFHSMTVELTKKLPAFVPSFNIALWPVWSFMTPLLLFIQFMGVVMLVSLLG